MLGKEGDERPGRGEVAKADHLPHGWNVPRVTLRRWRAWTGQPRPSMVPAASREMNPGGLVPPVRGHDSARAPPPAIRRGVTNRMVVVGWGSGVAGCHLWRSVVRAALIRTPSHTPTHPTLPPPSALASIIVLQPPGPCLSFLFSSWWRDGPPLPCAVAPGPATLPSVAHTLVELNCRT